MSDIKPQAIRLIVFVTQQPLKHLVLGLDSPEQYRQL